ncbi:hypothetical protein F503_08025 [Ophiostoma piceae UAMH 11346]|uniref:Cytochrome oxidase c assembly domain-containing protein n=1 Tax=Ophiostoma piceae (strain UAMH 11346) TaxID=1262450 RepID=S3C1F7_OPHP1|nr:hypothetical protein F503_08025 [Ophiostoma piceae UAMH 11346]
MAIPPRSVRDATRFTSTIPHAAMSSSSASYSSHPANAAPPSRFQTPARPGPPPRRPGGGPPGGGLPPRGPAGASGPSDGLVGETPEQKVARLRAAHHAAKNAKVSQLDRVISGSRRLFDSAHRFTIIGLISFTAIAGVLTAYTAVDMMRYNKQRKAEFLEAQKQMDVDSLEAARLAFMRGDASPAQTALVEASRRAQKDGQESSEFFKVPSLLGAPKPAEGEAAAAAVSAAAAAPVAPAAPAATGWFGRKLATSEEGSTPGSSQQRLGYESLCEEDDSQGLRQSDLVRAVEDKALSALERERANQRGGGPLDRIGLEGQSRQGVAPAGGKSWWKFW